MHARYAPARRDVEEALLGALSPEAPWSLIEHFANENLIRESGSEDERTAAQYISDQLTRFGVEHTVHTPELFLSVPVRSRLVVDGRDSRGREFRAKSPLFPPVRRRKASRGRLFIFPISTPAAALTYSISSPRRRMWMWRARSWW